jgi:hypothetical protein
MQAVQTKPAVLMKLVILMKRQAVLNLHHYCCCFQEA